MKKQLLFFLTLLLAITPACTKQQRRGEPAMITGSILTGLGTASAIAILPCIWAMPALVAIPAGFFGAGIPLLEIGKEQMRYDAVIEAHQAKSDENYTIKVKNTNN